MKLNNKGLSLVETLVGLGIMGVSLYAFSTAFIQFKQITQNSIAASDTEKLVHDIIENVRSSISTQQIHFTNYSEAKNVENLPMAWEKRFYTTVEKCPQCQGRFGYTIQPLEQYAGLYMVTVKLTHATWKEKFKEYQFVVSSK